MSTSKQARKDAHEYARAQMYYGEGAGVRRRLIEASVESRALKDPAYRRAFDREYLNQDMTDHAEAARKERRRNDRSEALSKNARGLMTGNHQGVSTSVLLMAGVGYFAHQTGLDKKLYENGKAKYYELKYKWRLRKKTTGATVHNITDAKK